MPRPTRQRCRKIGRSYPRAGNSEPPSRSRSNTAMARASGCSTVAGRGNARIRRSRRCRSSIPRGNFRRRSARTSSRFRTVSTSTATAMCGAATRSPGNGKAADLSKWGPDGKVLMVLGKPGMPGNAHGYLSPGSAVVAAPNGDIYVVDGHGEGTNDRIVKFSKDGTFITAWGKHGKGPGEFETPHGIALDSKGRVYVADRANNRVQIFEPDGKFVAEWKQFGRPSDVAIDKNDMIYVADSQSTPSNNPGFKQGIRIGSVKDGKVTAFIPEPSVEAGAPEGVGVDDAGNVYAGWTAKMAVRRYVR